MTTNTKLIGCVQHDCAKCKAQADKIEALEAEVARLKTLSVTNIMIDVVPGDGSGFEVYAKSVDDVVNKLSELGSKAEDAQGDNVTLQAQLAAVQAEVERLKDLLSIVDGSVLQAAQRCMDRVKKLCDERDALQAQLAAAQGQEPAGYFVPESWDQLGKVTEWAQTIAKHGQPLYAAPIPQQPAEPTECCEHCDDGDGLCVFPMYGPAPHTHDTSSGWIGSTRTLPKEQWGNNFREDPDCKGHGVYMRCESCGRGEQQATAPSVPEGWKQAVALAYGHLWHVNNEPMAPIPLRSSETAAYEARKQLRDLLTHEERGLAINQVQALLAAAPQPKEPK